MKRTIEAVCIFGTLASFVVTFFGMIGHHSEWPWIAAGYVPTFFLAVFIVWKLAGQLQEGDD